jgi:hypothetical protein
LKQNIRTALTKPFPLKIIVRKHGDLSRFQIVLSHDPANSDQRI